MSEAAGNVKVILAADASSYSAALTLAQRQLDQLQGKAEKAGHSTVSSMQAASASIRLFEGGMTNNIRAVERFISSIPGVSKALQVAFPLVGAAALAGLLVKMGEEFAAFIKKAQDAPRVIENAFRELNISGQLTSDELRKTNDQLANQIARLEGKPQNNLVIALDDARIAADKLAQSLQNDNQKLTELLKQNTVGWFASLLTGQDDTKDMEKKVLDWQQKLADQGHAYSQAVHQYGPDTSQATAAKAALDKMRHDAEADMQAEIDYRKPGPDRAANVTGDQTANLNIAKGYLTHLQEQDDLETEQADNERLNKKQQALEHAKELSEAQKHVQEKMLQAFRQHLDQLKSEHELSAADEANYWTHLAMSVKQGSDAYKVAMDEAAKAIAPAIRQLAQERDKWQAAQLTPEQSFINSQGQQQTGTWDTAHDLSRDSDVTKGISEQSKAQLEWLKNLNAGVDLQRQ